MGEEPASYGDQLKTYRLAERLSVPRVAQRAGLHPNTLRKIEAGATHIPHVATRKRLAQALGLSAQQAQHLEMLAQQQHSSPARPRVPFIGRAPEIHLLRDHLSGARQPLLVLSGEPGIGKTALLDRASTMGIIRGMHVLLGTTPRSGDRLPYSPVVDALHQSLHRPYRTLSQDLSGCDWLTLLLPELLDPPFAVPRRHAPLGQERRLMFQAVLQFLEQSGGHAGTLLLLDDLQWAGRDALDLLAFLVRSASSRLRIIAAYRAQEVPPLDERWLPLADLARNGQAREHALGPLPASEADALLDALLSPHAPLDVALRQEVLWRGDGIPFFLVSYSFAAQDTGDQGALAIPWDIAQSVRQRLTVLPPASQEAVLVTALMDQAPRPVLQELLGQEEDGSLSALEVAEQAALLRNDGPNAYRITHDIIRDVVVETLSTARRARLHRAIATALQGTPGTPAAAIAAHFLQAGSTREALPYVLTAGDEAEAVFAHAEAEHHYLQARTIAQQLHLPAAEAVAWEKLATVWTMMAHYDRALDALERAIQLDHDQGTLDDMARAIAQLARLQERMGAPHTGRLRVEELLAHSKPDLSPRSLAALQGARAECLQTEGEHLLAFQAAEAACTCARLVHDEALLAESQARQGIALQMLDRLPEARRMQEEALPRLERTGNLEMLAVSLRELGWICLCMGDFAQGQQYRTRAVTLAETLQDPAQIAVSLANLAFVMIVGGRWTEADALLERSLAVTRSLGTPPATLYPLFVKGALELLRGAD